MVAAKKKTGRSADAYAGAAQAKKRVMAKAPGTADTKARQQNKYEKVPSRSTRVVKSGKEVVEASRITGFSPFKSNAGKRIGETVKRTGSSMVGDGEYESFTSRTRSSDAIVKPRIKKASPKKTTKRPRPRP